MVISTGTIRPSLACAWVAALNSLQNPMMLTPCWPSAGPTGGEGFAFPAGSCSLTIPVTFFAIADSVVQAAVRGLPLRLRLLHLHEIELHRGCAPEDRDQHPHAALVRIHFLHRAVEVGERSIDHADVVSFLELHLRLRLQGAFAQLRREPRDLVLAHRRGLGGVAHESGDLRRVLHQVPGAVVELHLHQDVPGEELALRGALLALHHLDDVLHRDQDVAEELLQRALLDLLLERLLRLVLEARVRVDHVPLLVDLLLLGGHGGCSLEGRVLDLVREELPEHVEEAEQDGGDHRGDDHGDGGGAGLGQARPAHLAQLRDNLERDLVRPRVDPEIDGGCAREPEPDHRAPGPVARQRAGERLGGPEGAEDREQHVLEEEARGDREHDVSDGGNPGVRHGSTEAIGRPARTRTWNMRFWRPPLYHWSYWPGWSPTSSPCAPYACGNGGRTWAGPACRSWSACSSWWCSSAPGKPGTPG